MPKPSPSEPLATEVGVVVGNCGKYGSLYAREDSECSVVGEAGVGVELSVGEKVIDPLETVSPVMGASGAELDDSRTADETSLVDIRGRVEVISGSELIVEVGTATVSTQVVLVPWTWTMTAGRVTVTTSTCVT